jgi:hypothetical protein
MGVLGKILGSDKVIAKGLELLDDAFETDAEARESKAKAKIDLMNAYAPFKVAQRYLALMFAGTFLACFLLVLVATMTDALTDEKLIAVRSIMAEFNIGWIMMTIVAFYFGGGLVESFGKKKE